MIEVRLGEDDRLDVALKAFKRKMVKSGILRDLRKKRYYVKPSEAKALEGGRGASAEAEDRPQGSREVVLARLGGWLARRIEKRRARSRLEPF